MIWFSLIPKLIKKKYNEQKTIRIVSYTCIRQTISSTTVLNYHLEQCGSPWNRLHLCISILLKIMISTMLPPTYITNPCILYARWDDTHVASINNILGVHASFWHHLGIYNQCQNLGQNSEMDLKANKILLPPKLFYIDLLYVNYFISLMKLKKIKQN